MLTLASVLASWSGLMFYFLKRVIIFYGDKLSSEDNTTYIMKLLEASGFLSGEEVKLSFSAGSFPSLV